MTSESLVERRTLTYDWNGHTDLPVSGAHLSDLEVAARVRMLMRTDLTHESTCELARDRIMGLSKEIDKLTGDLEFLFGLECSTRAQIEGSVTLARQCRLAVEAAEQKLAAAEARIAAERRQALEDARAAYEAHDRVGRDWIAGSIWDALNHEAAARVAALTNADKAGASHG